MFSIGDKVVYPMQGAGIIEKIERQHILGEDRDYFVLKSPYSDMKIMIPVKTCMQTGVRAIISAEEVDAVVEVLKGPSTKMNSNWNRRYRENMDRLKTGDAEEVAGVVRNLVRIERVKSLSAGEKKLLTNALRILASEFVMVLGIEPAAAEKLIDDAI